MRILFVLPGVSKRPIGGYKVVYEYANRLSDLGYECIVLFMCQETLQKYKFLLNPVRKFIVKGLVSYFPRWFQLSNRVKKIAVFDWTDDEVPDADAVFATSLKTVSKVNQLGCSKGKKYYLIQGFENWGNIPVGQLYATYNLGMTNIVIAKWLKKIVDEHSLEESIYIPNGLDFNVLGVDTLIEDRDPFSVAMLYHLNEVKGCEYGLKAIKILKEKFSEMKAHLFGVPERPADLPEWIDYTQNASQEQVRYIYNKAAIFICPTITEGFGLTGAESMACGCALVSTEYEGVLEYAKNGVNSLLSPVKDVNALVSNTEKLFLNNDLRIKIAKRGNQDIRRSSWDESVKKMCDILEKQ